jgi:flagellar hook protein FlgE
MSFQQGLSGLNAASSNLSAIGNNVANANTVGFKQSAAQFADLFSMSLSGANVSGLAGMGVSVSTVAQQFTQGNITTTTNPLDTAISGQGFFQLTTSGGSTVYSRNGQFSLDKNGFLVNAQGNQVNGYMPNAAGVILSGAVVPLKINPGNMPANPSSAATVGVNLNSSAAVPTTAVFNPTDPTSYTNSTSLSVIDSLGANHVGTLYFARQPLFGAPSAAAVPTIGASTTTTATLSSAAGLSVGNSITFSAPTLQTATITAISGNTVTFAALPAAPTTVSSTNAKSSLWNAYLTVDGASVPPLVAPATTLTPLTSMTFNTSGVMTSPLTSVTTAVLFPGSTTASNTQTININFNSTSSPSTQYGGAFSVNSLTQNGYASGQLTSTTTGTDGIVTGTYSNGQTRALGQMVLANFTGIQGLQDIGNNAWVQTAASGQPLVGAPQTGSLGQLQASATESSNVDLTAALVNMITAQRVYQANAQTIKTEDQVLQTVINMR